MTSEAGAEHVTLVVDPEFGEQAKTRFTVGPLWVVDSPSNTAVIKELWAAGKRHDANYPTYFNAVAGRSPEDSAAALIDTVDQHHPNWQTFEVIGAEPTGRLLGVLREYGDGSAERTPTGFIFSRPSNVT
jgi:hypothetical protein